MNVKDGLVDWGESVLQRWMGSITRDSTKSTYKSGFRLYIQYTGMTATQLIDEALEDAKKDPREKRDIVKQRLIGFYNWILEEAPKKRGGRLGGKVVGKGLSSKIAHTYVNAVRSFYGTFDVYVKLKGRSRLPEARVTNKRMILTNMDVKRLIDHTRTPRDRAIILTMFQSGMDVSTLCDLKYEDVAEGLTKDEYPLKLGLYRGKSGAEYYTFLGRDAISTIKAYLNDVKAKGLRMDSNSPLFLKQIYSRKGKTPSLEPMTTNLVQNMLKEVALKAGFIDEENNGRDFNPLNPHALRESFSSIMINTGVPDTIVDFWLGHKIGEMAEAYKGVQHESLKQMYLEREKLISITMPKVDVEELKAKLRGEIEQQNRQLQTMVNNVVSENIDLKSRISRTEQKLAELEKAIHKILEQTG